MAEYANPNALVSTQWVTDHLNDPNVRLIEVDVDTSAYDQGHIQGAVGVNWTTQLGDPIRRDIPSREAWSKLLSNAGVTGETRLSAPATYRVRRAFRGPRPPMRTAPSSQPTSCASCTATKVSPDRT